MTLTVEEIVSQPAPIQQEGIYLHYWRDMLEQAGYSASDIPQDWDGFWQFWQNVQQKLNSQQEEVFSFGFTTLT